MKRYLVTFNEIFKEGFDTRDEALGRYTAMRHFINPTDTLKAIDTDTGELLAATWN